MIDTPLTELASDQERHAPWSEATLREVYRRRARAKFKQALLDVRAGLRTRRAPWVLEREARGAARREIERGVQVENETRRRRGEPLVRLAVM